MYKPKYHIFVCSSSRINGEQKGFCLQKGAVEIINNFMEEIQNRELDGDVMITNTGCLGICSKGPIVIVYPEGIWYGSVKPGDVEEIMNSHIEGGEIVSRLAL